MAVILTEARKDVLCAVIVTEQRNSSSNSKKRQRTTVEIEREVLQHGPMSPMIGNEVGR
jgi:hypothetical protein